jgi:hypothetical protein
MRDTRKDWKVNPECKKETRQGIVSLYRVSGIHYKREKKADA